MVVGDTVKVLRGDEEVRDVEGKVTDVDTKTGKVVIEGVTIAKADGTHEGEAGALVQPGHHQTGSHRPLAQGEARGR